MGPEQLRLAYFQAIAYYFFMKTKKQTISKRKILLTRLAFAKVSQEIEGMGLTHKEIALFEHCIDANCTSEQMETMIATHLHSPSNALRR